MLMRLTALVLVALLWLVAACELETGGVTSTASPPATVTAMPDDDRIRVTNVVDGDTIDVEIDGETYRVRLVLIDTPEVHGRSDCYGKEASEFVKELLPLGTVVELERDVSETDRFGRLLRYVYLEDGTMVNELLLSEGYAQVATFPPDLRYIDRFLELQREAREAGRGLWSACVLDEDFVLIEVVTLTSPVETGGEARLVVAVDGASSCTLSYTTPAGSSSGAQGLGETLVFGGEAEWTWRIGASTRPGTGVLDVDCAETRLTTTIEVT